MCILMCINVKDIFYQMLICAVNEVLILQHFFLVLGPPAGNENIYFLERNPSSKNKNL